MYIPYMYTMAISMNPYILKSFDLPLLATFSESNCASSQYSLEYSSFQGDIPFKIVCTMLSVKLNYSFIVIVCIYHSVGKKW